MCFDRAYDRWAIQAHAPKNRRMAFEASVFTKVLRAQPLIFDEQGASSSQSGLFQQTGT